MTAQTIPPSVAKDTPTTLQVVTSASLASALPSTGVALIDPSDFSKSQVVSLVSPADQAKLAVLAGSLVNFDRRNPREKAQRAASIESVGSAAQTRAGQTSKMLDQPIERLIAAGDEGSPVANALISLKTEVDRVNPSRYRILEPGGVGRFFSFVPFVGTSMNRYFTKFQSSSSVIESVLVQLKAGVDRLKRDNEQIIDDKVRMGETNVELENVIAQALFLDKLLEEKAEAMIVDSDDRKFVDEELRFPLRQRIKDLQTQLAVNQQGILSLEIVRRNNLELIRGARRCETVTFTALKIAVQVALALANQRIVLRTIDAVDQTTNALMLQNAQTLRTQGVEIHKKAVSQGISIETLRKSFEDINAAYDDLRRFRTEALPEMKNQMLELSGLTGNAAKAIERLEKGDSARSDILELTPATS
ncbi:MAG: toxic anion resistance protein [Candidatus Paceibacterota bacterium]|jgi:uncharacterized protein YaaN involved in tellurite resistance